LQFDPDGNGSIEAEDIVRVFARINGVTWEKAHAIAHTILDDADTTDEKGEALLGGLSYTEYITCLEGDAVKFDKYLEFLDPVEDVDDREKCQQVFEEARAAQQAHLAELGGQRERTAKQTSAALKQTTKPKGGRKQAKKTNELTGQFMKASPTVKAGVDAKRAVEGTAAAVATKAKSAITGGGGPPSQVDAAKLPKPKKGMPEKTLQSV